METILDKLQRRYAVKKFDANKEISDNDLETLLEAIRLAPSSYWLQWWKTIVIKEKSTREQLVEHSRGQKQVVEASALIILCRPTTFNDKNVDEYINDIIKTRWVTKESLEWYEKMMKAAITWMSEEEKIIRLEKQLYIALWFLLETAAAINIDTCPMEWFVPEEYSKILWLEKIWVHPVLVCPVWYRSEDDSHSSMKKVRFNKEEIIIRL